MSRNKKRNKSNKNINNQFFNFNSNASDFTDKFFTNILGETVVYNFDDLVKLSLFLNALYTNTDPRDVQFLEDRKYLIDFYLKNQKQNVYIINTYPIQYIPNSSQSSYSDMEYVFDIYYKNLYEFLKSKLNSDKPVYCICVNMGGMQHVNLLVLYKKNIYSLDTIGQYYKKVELNKYCVSVLYSENDFLDTYLTKEILLKTSKDINESKQKVLQYINKILKRKNYENEDINCIMCEIDELTNELLVTEAEFYNIFKENEKMTRGNTISFFEYVYNRIQEEKQETFENIYYNVGEIYGVNRRCNVQIVELIEKMRNFYKVNQNDFEICLQTGLKVYGSNEKINYENIKENVNYFMLQISDNPEHKKIINVPIEVINLKNAIIELNNVIQNKESVKKDI